MGLWIRLPYGGSDSGFDVEVLVAHIVSSGRDYIIQGGQNCILAKHTKPNSLDVWLRRSHTHLKDTRQAVKEVVDSLVATELFQERELICPDSGRSCKGVKLTPAGLMLAHKGAQERR